MAESNSSDGTRPARRRSLLDPFGLIADTVVPTIADAVDVDDIVSRIDVDALLDRIDVDAFVSRIDIDRLMARIDVDALLSRIDIGGLMARIDVDALVSRIDVDGLMGRVDVDALVARIDVDGLIGRVDVGALMSRVDVDGLIGRVDVDSLVSRVDVDGLIRRVDVDALMSRVDVDGLIGRVDVDAMMARVDIDAVVRRIDVPAVVDRIDIDAVVDRVDIDRIVQRADLAGIVAQSTRGITASTVDLVRRQIVGVDEVITRLGARVARRDPNLDPSAPVQLQRASEDTVDPKKVPSISGHYAGPAGRAAALVIDWFTMVTLFGLATAIGSWTIDVLTGRDGEAQRLDPPWSTLIFAAWALTYFVVPLAATGRTFGKAVVGLRVVRRDGSPLHTGQALVRVLVLPLSFALLGLGLIGSVFGRERRTLHDVVARSVEVIDWGDRPAALPSPLSDWIERRNAASQGAA